MLGERLDEELWCDGEGCIMLAGGEVSCRLLSAIPSKARVVYLL